MEYRMSIKKHKTQVLYKHYNGLEIYHHKLQVKVYAIQEYNKLKTKSQFLLGRL